MLPLVILAILSIAAVVGSVILVSRDGYGRVPTRTANFTALRVQR